MNLRGDFGMNNYWFTHYKLYRDIKLSINYKTLTPLRIGASKGKSPFAPIDLQVIRININGREVPYIPGSSLKGVFRSASESITKSYNIETCSSGSCSEIRNNGYRNGERLRDALKNNNLNEVINILNNYCICCKLFGSTTYASHIKFGDAYPNDGKVSLGVKTGIAINRRSGAVKRGALYDVEFVSPDSEFNGEIILNNTPNYAIGLLAKVIDNINIGLVRFGGFKSRGFGKVKLTITAIDGIINTGDGIKSIKEIDILPALDDNDKCIRFDPNNPSTILENAKKVFEEYAKSSSNQ